MKSFYSGGLPHSNRKKSAQYLNYYSVGFVEVAVGMLVADIVITQLLK